MKNYIIKSSIVFFMVLILGLILLPILSTEKEYIASNGYELLVDSERMTYTDDNYYTYDVEESEYKIFVISFYNYFLDGELFVHLTYNSNTVLVFGGEDVVVQYFDDKIILHLDFSGDFDISVWGVYK